MRGTGARCHVGRWAQSAGGAAMGVLQRSRWYLIFVVVFVFTDVLQQQAHRKEGAALLAVSVLGHPKYSTSHSCQKAQGKSKT